MDNNILISIILPAFNAEEYIAECIQSILSQSFSEWELIIVNDGSTDRTSAICEVFAESDDRIKVVSQKNAGASAARNRGLDLASGAYIAFVDADDYLPPESLDIRKELIDGADMALAGFVLVSETKKNVSRMPDIKRSNWNRHEALENVIASGEIGYQGFLWNKLFRRECIVNNKIRFTEGIKYNEDRLFCVNYVLNCNSVNLDNRNCYFYRQNTKSTMANVLLQKNADVKQFMTEFEAYDRMIKLVNASDYICKVLCIKDAFNRAVYLKKECSQNESVLQRALEKRVWYYGGLLLLTPKKMILPMHKKTILKTMLRWH